MAKKQKYTVVSLFSGAGGMDIGFDLEGFKTIWANDFDKDSCETHRAWSGAKVIDAPIEKVDLDSIPNADVVLGGFPCQGFSLAGPRKVDDKRNVLYRNYVAVIDKLQPKAFVAENVKGILTLGGGEIIKVIVREFSDKGYNVQFKLVNAADYNVPEDRYRVIMVGIRKDIKSEFKYPEPSKKKVTLRDALERFPEPKDEEVLEGGFSPRFMSRNRKRNWDQQAFTVPAMAKQVTLHPASPDMIKIDKDLWEFGEGRTRRLSWKEAAAVQTFPENMYFAGKLVSIYKQIGNAVPVNLARSMAKELYKTLEDENKMNSIKLDQTTQGKAYEYACLQSIVESVKAIRKVVIIQNSSLLVAQNAWDLLNEELKDKMRKSSMAGVASLIQLEPKIIEDGNDDLELSLQEDRRGQEGDVRDVLIIHRKIAWEIGISVKHNHSAVKHSRISPTINFGKDWLGLNCSDQYFEEIKPIFKRLHDMKVEGLRWSEVENKNGTVYVPLLASFMKEIRRLDSENKGLVPARLLEYLLGRKDFYKIISNDANRFTTLQCFNLHGSLNTPSGDQAPSLKVRGVEMPSIIYHLDFKDVRGDASETTVQLVMDNNWAITFRIHSAKTLVETSLKFDIQLTGVPSSMFSNSVSW